LTDELQRIWSTKLRWQVKWRIPRAAARLGVNPPMNPPSLNSTPPGYDDMADVRDGLNGRERVVLYVLRHTQKERGDRNVPTAMLWGRVCEYFYISPDELSEMLARLGARA